MCKTLYLSPGLLNWHCESILTLSVLHSKRINTQHYSRSKLKFQYLISFPGASGYFRTDPFGIQQATQHSLKWNHKIFFKIFSKGREPSHSFSAENTRSKGFAQQLKKNQKQTRRTGRISKGWCLLRLMVNLFSLWWK